MDHISFSPRSTKPDFKNEAYEVTATALVPISVSTNLFSSNRMLEGLKALSRNYTNFVFLVADRLQMYNDAWSSQRSESEIYKYWAVADTALFLERRRWIQRLALKAGINQENYKVFSMDDVSDEKSFKYLRELIIFYSLNQDFLASVESQVDQVVNSKKDVVDVRRAKGLFRIYVVEELALNLRARTKFGLFDEFYLGPPIQLLPDLLYGKFSWFLRDIGYDVSYDLTSAKFFFWSDASKWQLYRVV